jgi:hypothetical protein
MAYKSPWSSIYGSASNPPTAPLPGFPLARPIPSATHNIWNIRNRTRNRRFNIVQPRTQSEQTSVSLGQFGGPRYHEAALCSSNFENLAQRITNFLQQNNVEAAAALAHDCAKERWTYGKNQFGRLDQAHSDVVNLLHQVYSVLTAAGRALDGGTCFYQQDRGGANKRFYFDNNNHRVAVTVSGPQQIYGGKRKVKSKTRKQRKTRRHK